MTPTKEVTPKRTKAKAAKPKEPKKEKAPKRDDLRVFAFRLPIADRDLIHQAADSKQVSATKFVVDTVLEASRKVLDRT